MQDHCQVEIRRVRPSELDTVYLVELEVFGSDAYPYWYMRFLYAVSPDMFFVARCNDSIIGYIVGLQRRSFCHLVSIAVRTNMQGKGVGSRLLRVFEESCRRKGYGVVLLEVEATNNKAISFYMRHGFRPLRFIPGYYGAGRHAILMVKVVNNQP